MTDATHPAGSAEFLSRLHDRELSPAEASAFESHRASCPTCREAVAEFERSLAAFRTAPAAPVPSDLSARILRKIRAQSPSRRPFGVMFGIDIRWAGALLAALLVAIIAPALLTRREMPQNASAPDAISAHIVELESDKAVAPAEERRTRAEDRPKAPEEKSRTRSKEEIGGRVAAAAPPPVPAAAPRAADEVAQKAQSAREAESPAPSALSKRAIASAERAGGEAGSLDAEAKASESIRLEVRPLDGEGSPPAIVTTPSDDRLGSLRGREFILTVEAGGQVSAVAPLRPEPGSALRKDSAASMEPVRGAGADLLRELRFQPGGRPRRLLVRVR